MKLRTAMARYGFRQYEVAEICGYSEFAFSRLLRKELPEEFQIKLNTVLSQIKQGEKYDDSFIKEFKCKRKSTPAYKQRISRRTDRILDYMEEKRLLERGVL